MRKNKSLALVVTSLFLATLWGCGSNMDSGGDQTGPGSGIADAAKLGSSTCKICHTAIAVDERFNLSVHDTDAVGCEGCHGGGQFHKGIGEIPFRSPAPAQCTAVCHTLTASTSLVSISDSHYDDPATAAIIEGLVVKTAESTGCQVCHYSDHDPELTINNEWANSAHGGHLATGPVTSATADAWVHYNWDDTATRGSCQRCHTATGISNFLNNPAGYVANGSGNNFGHLSNWSATGGSGQQEVLYCWGCHSDVSEATLADAKLRNPGAITENYTAVVSTSTGTSGTAATVVYPDVAESNVCMGCHLGREVGQNIKNITDANGQLSFVNSHYLTAGGTIFNKSGYEYDGQTYANFGFHKQLGVGDPASNFNTGSSGPCVTCHMSVASGHTFSFVTKDPDGAIEANNSPICTNCHAGMDGGTLEATKERFHTALNELKLALDARGIFFFNSHPYFFAGANGTGGAFTNWESVATTLGVGLAVEPTGTGWKNVMGAAFNYNTLEHDPGAYAHNSDYALKLIADSIDFLDNGVVDASAASLASTLIGQGMNIASGAGFSPIHGDPAVGFVDGPVAAAVANPTTSQATCSRCHPASPHYGGYPALSADGVTPDRDTVRPQWVNNQVNEIRGIEPVGCAVCHANNDPSLNQPILTQYADSGHGDVNGAWTHEEDGSTCSRCHTTTGYIGHMATPATSFTYGAADPLQTLNCNGCHTSLVPGLLNATRRTPGAYIATWSSGNVTASVTYPDAGDSNLCIRCHSARRSGSNITSSVYANSHYLPAAAVLFGGNANMVLITANTSTAVSSAAVGETFTGGGYEFAGQIYTDLSTHKTIGQIAVPPALVATGPCVGCHMNGAAGHTWNAVTHNEVTGEITAINSGACSAVGCHDGLMTPAALNAFEATFTTALETLNTQLKARGIFYNPANGNFYQDAAFTLTANNSYYATLPAQFLPAVVSVRDLQGAAYNYWLFKYHGADPAGYVHNTFYSRKLIADSINLLDDGIMQP